MIDSVLILGSGALSIGQAGEFDYSGTQAIKALNEEGIRTILVNPNIATVQTSRRLADKLYLLPVRADFVSKVIEKERPDGILLSFGGQTALNCGLELADSGILEKYGVKVLGTPIETIRATEDRKYFTEKLAEIGVPVPRSIAASTPGEAIAAANSLGYPVILRAAYTLGGLGSGFVNNENELIDAVKRTFHLSPQILVEKSLKGWKEIEYEVVRDSDNNCVTVCNMENFDPMGIHTGESLVVAPSQTLNNHEYHLLRETALKVIRHLQIVGECNIQYALDPLSDTFNVIEVNARLSRSSALASKATGYPLAWIAAKLAIGKTMPGIANRLTKTTTACFEPALDYVVVKMPKWDLAKFPGVSGEIGSSMKSVGEVMAIGRCFEEALQKALRMVGEGMHGLMGNHIEVPSERIEEILTHPTDKRILAIAKALSDDMSIDRISELTGIDRWFLYKLSDIVLCYRELEKYDENNLPDDLLLHAKRLGFSDFQLARACMSSCGESMDEKVLLMRKIRLDKGIAPYVKQIDSVAAEFPTSTNYLYVTYNAEEDDIEFNERKAVAVLGSGAYRIGSSVEFDWCCVRTLDTLRDSGFKTIMINHNPETVSTDYDVCDRLYFEELSLERVLDIYEKENPIGLILSMGGQIPNKLALRCLRSGIRVLGTQPASIDRAEDRSKFSSLLDEIKVDQPPWKELTSVEAAKRFAREVGYPVLVRPSYVLSGIAMNVAYRPEDLENYLGMAAKVSKEAPVVISKFITDAKEIEIDAVAAHGEVIAYAISEHIEHAGVHSGDATILFPPQKIYVETIRRIKRIARLIAAALEITGPFNIQFLAKENNIQVIECNLRASRSFPFVSKVLDLDMIALAVKAMIGFPVEKVARSLFDLNHLGIKAPMFSFTRLTGADPVLGVEMASTGEVGCLGDSVQEAFLKAMFSVGYAVPKKGVFLSTGPIHTKVELMPSIKQLADMGLQLFGTPRTADFYCKNGIDVKPLGWPDEPAPNAITAISEGWVDLVINIPKNLEPNELDNDFRIRRMATDLNVPLLTNTQAVILFIESINNLTFDDLAIRCYDEYFHDGLTPEESRQLLLLK
ncbi:MAG: carbamoyl-phosphate synthase (glutamine-hydrolyzing) large subunit [bacterium]